MISLPQILTVDNTFTAELGSSKKRVLQNLAKRLATNLEGVSDSQLFDELIARERLGSTGVGEGVAVPHCRLDSLNAPIAALAKLPTSIAYDAIDKRPVDLIFLLAVPQHATDEHLQLLAAVIKRVSDQTWMKRLRACSNAEALHQLFVSDAS